MPHRAIRAVLFDFDGVIVHSEPLHLRAFQEVLATEKIDLSEEEYYRDLIGFDDKGAFRHLFTQRGRELDPKTFLRVMARKGEVMMDLIRRRQYHPLPGVQEFVRGLWWHYPLAICSGALREEIEAMLEGIGLRDCFGVITAAEDVSEGKPNPEGYLLTVRNLSERAKASPPLKPAECLVIEDAPTVIESVKNEGFPVLAVATSYPAERLEKADWVFKSLRPEEVDKKLPLRLGP